MDNSHTLSELGKEYEVDVQISRPFLVKKYDSDAEPLDEDSASRIIYKIRAASKKVASARGRIRVYLYNLKVREGYKALGFRSFRACVVKNFSDKATRSQLYREVAALEVEHRVAPNSPIGEIPESVLREVAKLKKPEDQIKAWKRAMKKKRNRVFPTAAIVQKIVNAMIVSGEALPKRKPPSQPKLDLDKRLVLQIQSFESELVPALEQLRQHRNKNLFVSQLIEPLDALASRILQNGRQ